MPRLLTALALAGLLAVAALTTRSEAATTCGVERWTVKTLQDRPKLIALKDTTIKWLVTRARPAGLSDVRLPFERHVYRVRATVSLVRDEADSDLHLVLEDAAGRTMIAESPSPSCTNTATPTRRKQMAQTRAKVRVCGKALVTGVAFWDFKHGQTGVAPNAIELHPILAFRCLAETPPPIPPQPSPPTVPSSTTTTTPTTGNCAPSYPTVCIPPPPPDLDCKDIPYRNFTVRYDVPAPDPHRFDGDRDGIGCEQ